MNHILFASERFPLARAAAGGYFLPFALPPAPPRSAPARLLPLGRPGGFPCCQKINLMLFLTEGKTPRSPPAWAAAALSAAGHPRRDEGGRGMCWEGCGQAGQPEPRFHLSASGQDFREGRKSWGGEQRLGAGGPSVPPPLRQTADPPQGSPAQHPLLSSPISSPPCREEAMWRGGGHSTSVPSTPAGRGRGEQGVTPITLLAQGDTCGAGGGSAPRELGTVCEGPLGSGLGQLLFLTPVSALGRLRAGSAG